MSSPPFLTEEQAARLSAKIGAAEQRTSAQIKVVIAQREWLGIERKARRVFHQLGLDKTEARNCVLLLLVPRNRQFHIHGDEGIHQRVGQAYWDDVRTAIAEELRAGRKYDALALGVELLGEKLAQLFPAQSAHRDELRNEVLFVA